MLKKLTQCRHDFLFTEWCEESADPETQEWREELTAEEEELVASWDKAYAEGVKSLCRQILNHEVLIATKWHEPEFNG